MALDFAAFRRLGVLAALVSTLLVWSVPVAEAGERWRGLEVADPLTDCQVEYDPDDYDYDRATLLPLLKDRTSGAIFSPYTRRVYLRDGDVDVEHIVAKKEATTAVFARRTPRRASPSPLTSST